MTPQLSWLSWETLVAVGVLCAICTAPWVLKALHTLREDSEKHSDPRDRFFPMTSDR
jgi:hypothetical protein